MVKIVIHIYDLAGRASGEVKIVIHIYDLAGRASGEVKIVIHNYDLAGMWWVRVNLVLAIDWQCISLTPVILHHLLQVTIGCPHYTLPGMEQDAP